MCKIPEQVTSVKDVCLDKHFRENPFPLDGTDWAREIREHQLRDKHPNWRCSGPCNFLSKLHGCDSLLRRQRAVISDVMDYWFHDLR
jgi:hypothetical protein